MKSVLRRCVYRSFLALFYVTSAGHSQHHGWGPASQANRSWARARMEGRRHPSSFISPQSFGVQIIRCPVHFFGFCWFVGYCVRSMERSDVPMVPKVRQDMNEWRLGMPPPSSQPSRGPNQRTQKKKFVDVEISLSQSNLNPEKLGNVVSVIPSFSWMSIWLVPSIGAATSVHTAAVMSSARVACLLNIRFVGTSLLTNVQRQSWEVFRYRISLCGVAFLTKKVVEPTWHLMHDQLEIARSINEVIQIHDFLLQTCYKRMLASVA